MNHEHFSAYLDEAVEHMKTLMGSKNGEYAPGGDKLSNFKKASRMTGKSPEECLWMFASKHIISIQDIVNAEGAYTPDALREKCGDLRAYTVLLEALMQERHT